MPLTVRPRALTTPVSCARRALICILSLVIMLALAPLARADELGLISGPTPFPRSCGVPGTPTLNSTAEPTIAVNPRDRSNVVVSWQQDRFNIDGGALSNLVGVSHDGGRHFHPVRVPGVSRCTGGADERASDPWLSIASDGTVLLASLSFSEMPQNNAIAGPTKLVVSRSHDGGETWSAPVDVQPFDQTYNDREAVVADPGRPKTAYYVFVKRYGAEGESGFEMFSRTTDGGATWSAPAPIYTPPAGMLTDPTLLEVLPDGTLVNVLIVANLSPFLPSPAPKIAWTVIAQRSTDGGASWSGATTIASIDPFPAMDPDTGKVVRAYPVISTTHAANGTTYVAWNDIPSATAGSKVLLAKSSDAGRTWSSPTTIESSPGQAFLPSIAAGRDGTLGVTYDDTRNNRPGQGKLLTDVWFAQSRDGGASWHESHVAGPFDTLTAPESDSS
ncbi:MAG TPA: sialidase family protein, partial [Solirubrobacteraceae bacterium]|nr:sialidase family protein [Solirubrobacteraceae bacterium]